MASERKPLLDLSTLVRDRETVRIDEVDYPLANRSEFSLLDEHKLTELSPALETFAKRGRKTPESIEAATRAMRDLCVLILPTAPAEVLDKLTELQRSHIIVVFMVAAGFLTPAQAQAVLTPQPRRQTTGRSSRGSNASTAESPTTG